MMRNHRDATQLKATGVLICLIASALVSVQLVPRPAKALGSVPLKQDDDVVRVNTDLVVLNATVDRQGWKIYLGVEAKRLQGLRKMERNSRSQVSQRRRLPSRPLSCWIHRAAWRPG